MDPEVVLERLAAALAPLCEAYGCTRLPDPGAGRPRAEFRSPRSALRLTWLPADSAFVLEADRLPSEPLPGPWIDLCLQRYDPAHGDDAWVRELASDFTEAAREHLGVRG
ncbi:MAG: hypothetical protein H6828_10340 [Planctomycetes bacterium]|nr:hypothetical protein [Planctomycetota bacterium]